MVDLLEEEGEDHLPSVRSVGHLWVALHHILVPVPAVNHWDSCRVQGSASHSVAQGLVLVLHQSGAHRVGKTDHDGQGEGEEEEEVGECHTAAAVAVAVVVVSLSCDQEGNPAC